MGGFQRVFEENGGKIVKKLWPPLVTPDYTPYIAQIERLSTACCQGFAGSNPLQLHEAATPSAGLKIPGDRRLDGGRRSAAASRSATRRSASISRQPATRPSSRPTATSASSTAMREELQRRSGRLRRRHLRRLARCSRPALKTLGGKIEDKDALIEALQGGQADRHAARAGQASTSSATWSATSTSASVREAQGRQARQQDRSRPTTNVSQFWTYDEEKFLDEAGLFARLPAAEAVTNAGGRCERRPPFDCATTSAGASRL